LTERFDLYLGVVVTLMFLIGCVLIVVSARERSEERRRWRSSTVAKSGAARRKPATMSPNGNLERILESAIVMSWDDLMRGAHAGLIHIEYGFSAGGTLDYLKVWSSLTRGHWLLACEYWMSANTFHAAGAGFDNGYQSEGLAHILEFVMQHQNSFMLPPNLGRQGLLQISTPTVEESAAAAALINEVFDRLASPLEQPAVA
jgi:hypothetical protein